MNPIEFFKEIEGVGDDGNPKAIITVQNETMSKDANGEPFVHDEAATTQAVVSFAMNNNMLVVALLWDNDEDTEYLRFKGFLKEFERDANVVEENPPHFMILNLADAGNYEHFIACVVTSYVLAGDKPMIKFLCKIDEAALYQLTDDEIATMTDEIADELAYEESIEDIALI